MVRLFVLHTVKDYDIWRAGYDAGVAFRESFGVRGDRVFRGIDDPAEITVWHDFDDAEAAKRFRDAPELRDKMAELGVASTPIVWIAAHT